MKIRHTFAAFALAAFSLLAAMPVTAGDGHDHGEAPVAATGPALPRFTAVSETFELVGVVKGKQITLYLDRFADGSPVKGAKLELELGGIKIPVEQGAEGEYRATLAQELKAGNIAVSVTVMAGDENDLLAGELDLHDETEHAPDRHERNWKGIALWIVLGGGGLLVMVILIRRLRNARNARLGGAA